MSKEVKRYSISNYYCIECVTEVDRLDVKRYTVSVVFLPFEEYMEVRDNITDVNEANRVFVQLRDKYRGVDNFWK